MARPSSSSPLIEAAGLTKRFGGTTAVDGLTLAVAEGEVFGLLGPNGAGKTTTVRMLSCLISKTSGEARVDGHEVGDPAGTAAIRAAIGVLPESVGMYDDLSAYKNLDYYGRLYGCAPSLRSERIRTLLTAMGLWEARDLPVGGFSKGMRQKVAIARALVHDPKVVFLDEPTANLDPASSRAVRDFVLSLGRERKTVFVNTHNLAEAERICDRIGIMKTRLLTVGTPQELRMTLGARKTAIRLERVDEGVVEAVRRSGHDAVEVEGDTLVVQVQDPDAENPALVRAVVNAGGSVRLVSDRSPTLEDAYLRHVGGEAR